jgi:hypothetical protein
LEKSELDLCNRERNVKLKFKSFPQNPSLSLKFLRRPSKEGLFVVVREKVRKKGRSRTLAKKRKKPTFPSGVKLKVRKKGRSRTLAKKRKKPTFPSGVKLVPRIEKMDNFFKFLIYFGEK